MLNFSEGVLQRRRHDSLARNSDLDEGKNNDPLERALRRKIKYWMVWMLEKNDGDLKLMKCNADCRDNYKNKRSYYQ